MFKNINIKEALDKERLFRKDEAETAFVHEVFDILNDEVYSEYDLLNRIKSKNGRVRAIRKPRLIEEERIYTDLEIKNICVKYRLRFLDADKFKPDIPYEAIQKIKMLEQEQGQQFDHFKIVAPSTAFELEDCDKDPILFLSLGNGMFYFIHDWGNDLAWYRKLLVFPFRSFVTLGLCIFILSLFLTLLIPTTFIEGSVIGTTGFARLAFFMWVLISITASVTYIGLAFFKNVSCAQWSSPFFKQHF